jgi:hypothetical protein
VQCLDAGGWRPPLPGSTPRRPRWLMARNRKYQSAAIRFGPALKAFLLCLLIGGSGVGYVWQKNQIYKLDWQIRNADINRKTLVKQNARLKTQLATMETQGFIETRISELKLGLVAPQPSQIWRLEEPPAAPPGPPAGRQYAQQTPATPLRAE